MKERDKMRNRLMRMRIAIQMQFKLTLSIKVERIKDAFLSLKPRY